MLLVGARSLDEQEELSLRASDVAWLSPAEVRDTAALAGALSVLAERVDAVHVHVDLEVFDPSIAPANEYAADGGLLADDVERVVGRVADLLPICSATLAAYDPAYDPEGSLRDVALRLLEQLAALGTPGPG